MRYRIYTEQEVLEKSQLAVHLYFNRDREGFLALLSDDFVWIGSYDFHYTQGKQAFLAASSQESEEEEAQISNEEYHLLSHNRRIWVVYGRFTATSWRDGKTLLYTRQRLTFVWKQDRDRLQLLHINCTMARDIPLEISGDRDRTDGTNVRWFDYIRQLEGAASQEKPILIKDHTGGIHRFKPLEIIYASADNQRITVYTASGNFQTRRTLAQLLEDVPQLMQVHKSWLVNPSYVRQIRRYYVTLSEGTKIPVGKSRYNAVKEALASDTSACRIPEDTI